MNQVLLTSSFNRLTKACLHVVGIWPGSRYTVLHRLTWITTMIMSQYLQYWYVVAHINSDDLSDLVDGITTSLQYSLTFFKLLTVWSKRRIFYDILSAMSADWNDSTLTEWDECTMASNADFSQRCSKCIISGYWMCMCFYGADIVVSWGVFGERKFIMRMEFPMDSTVSPTYELVMFAQLLQQLVVVTVESILNALILILIFHAGSQVDIVCQRLFELSPDNNEACKVALKIVVHRHNRVIIFFNYIKDFYSYIALMNFVLAVVILCLIGFTIIISMDSGNGPMMIMKFLPYYAGINFMAFISCFSGEYVSTKSKSISDAAYQIFWYDLKPSTNRIILLLMLRSQRPLTITAGKFMDLSLECFLTILKTSASYMSVLHAMY